MNFILPILLIVSIDILSSAEPNVWFNGMNVPWNHFAYDIGAGQFEPEWFETFFSMCKTNHLNVARFWLHINGASSPTFNNTRYVTGLPDSFLHELNQLVSISLKYEVVLQLALWSFDMFKGDNPRDDLVSDVSKTRTYIDNALVPMVKNLSHYNNVIIEVMNEPEWAIKGPGNTPKQVSAKQMQRFTAMIAEAVHQNSKLTVTTGSASLKWNSAQIPPAEANYWNDTQLIAANPSGSKDGVLDFYNVHYYDWMYNPDWGYDPCRENATDWMLEKVTVIAELPPTSDHYSTQQMMDCAFKNGFYGDMFWAYNDPQFPWKDALKPLNTFYNQHSTAASYTALTQWLHLLRMDN